MRQGEVVGDRFEVHELAGAGGMGTVHRALDRATGNIVAVKALHAARLDQTARFAREVEALAALHHPAIVRYLGHGATDAGQPWLAMEWLEGQSLSRRLAREPLTVADALAVGVRLADALAAAHAAGIVHRDLKPSNVLLRHGSVAETTLIDFGIATVTAQPKLTHTGDVVGTVGWMAPEQARGERDIDARADVFSLGALLWACLTGEPPFAGDNALSVLVRMAESDAPRVRAHRADVPAALDALLARMLARPRSARPADAGVVLRELEQLFEAVSTNAGHHDTGVDDRDPRIAPGATIGRLRLVRMLGAGGMGRVWLAEHLTLKTRVAVKFLSQAHARNPQSIERFAREAAAAAQLRSQHVVQILDHVLTADDEPPHIVMELLEGEDLGHRLGRLVRLPLGETAAVVGQVARALARAHGVGIVHRDIKPENVFRTEVDGEPLMKVLDFGIAKHDAAEGPGVTTTGTLLGTPYYMSPEQVVSARHLDWRTDLWSLAAVAYRCVTGQPPFMGESVGAVIVAIDRGVFPAPSTLVNGVPPAVDAWFARALARDPARRFSSAKEMADAFQEAAGATRAPQAPATAPLGSMPELGGAHAETPPLGASLVAGPAATFEGATLTRPAARPGVRAMPVLLGVGLLAGVGITVLAMSLRGSAPPESAAASPAIAESAPTVTTAGSEATTSPSATVAVTTPDQLPAVPSATATPSARPARPAAATNGAAAPAGSRKKREHGF